MNTKRNTILLVDNDADTINLLVNILEDEYEVLTAGNIKETLALLENVKDTVSVVIFNLVMSETDSQMIFDAIKSDSLLAGIPAIVLAESEDSSAEARAFDSGAFDVIRKPFNAKIILQRIKNIITHELLVDMKMENAFLMEQKQSNVRLQSVLDNMTGGVALIEYCAGIPNAIFLNKSFIGYGGYPEDEYYRHAGDMFYFVHKDDLPHLTSVVNKALSTHQPFVQEIRTNDFDGGVSWLNIQGMEIEYPESSCPVILLHLTDITELKTTEEELRRRAEYDTLTNICNKETFFFKTAQMLAKNPDKEYVLARWNIERFKVINDLFGFDAGDEILKEIAYALREELHSIGTFGRLEADHFAACFPSGMLDADKMLANIDGYLKRKSMNYAIVIDMGIFYIDDARVPVDQMCDRANLALQTVKGKYLKRWAVYDKELRDALIQEQEIISEMSAAIDERQFVIYLQPVYSLSTMEAVSAEALVRWVHPKKGIISPGMFIPLFEKNGFIERLDRYVWEEACRYLQSRRNRGLPRLPVSVNVSRVNLYNPNLCNDICELVGKYDIEPSLLKLEITESAYTDSPEQLLSTMHKLQEKGFNILMDDFGSGYSSLNMLKDVPVDILKIDMRFLFGFETSSRAGNIITSVVRMAKWLNIPVIAEGVENKQQSDFLHSIGCDLIQGFYFSRPLPVDNFEEKLLEKVGVASPQIKISEEETDFDLLFNGSKLINRVFNSVIGGIGFYELVGDTLEVIRVNDGYYDLLGYTPQTLYQDAKNVLDKVYHSDRELVLEACRRTASGQCAAELVIRRYKCNGNIAWLRINVRYLSGSDERPMICLAINDITQYKENEQVMIQQEKELSQHFEFLDNLYKSIPCGIMQFSTDRSIRMIAANCAACRMLGYPDEQQLKEAFLLGYGTSHENSFSFISELIDKYMKYPRKTDFEYAITRDGGGQLWIRGTLENGISISGESVIHIIFLDITKQKLKELQATEKTREIERHHQFLSILYDTVPCGIIHHSLENPAKLLDYNRAARSILGFSESGEPENKFRTDVFANVHPADKDYCSRIVDVLISNEKSVEYEYRIISNGQVRWIHGSVHIVRTIDGAKVAQCAFMDITHQKQSELRRKESFNMLDGILKRLPVGVNLFELKNDKRIVLLYSSRLTYELLGFTHEELVSLFENGTVSNLISNTPKLHDFLYNTQADTTPPTEICFSINNKNGGKTWLNFVGMIKTSEQGQRLCYSTIVNVTDKIEKSRIQLQQKELFTMLIESTGVMIFEYDPHSDVMCYSTILPDGTLKDKHIRDYMNYIETSKLIRDNCREKFVSSLKAACAEAGQGKLDFEWNLTEDNYKPYHAFYKSLCDENGKVYRFIGCCLRAKE